MTCAECLRYLETADLDEVAVNDTVMQHATTCHDCSEAVGRVLTAERELSLRVAAAQSPLTAGRTAEQALVRLRRRHFAQVWGIAGTVLLAATLWIIWLRVLVPGIRETQALVKGESRTETIPLSCLSSEQAGQLLSPYLRSNGSVYYTAKPPLRVITVRSSPEELKTVHDLLARFDRGDRSVCSLP